MILGPFRSWGEMRAIFAGRTPGHASASVFGGWNSVDWQ